MPASTFRVISLLAAVITASLFSSAYATSPSILIRPNGALGTGQSAANGLAEVLAAELQRCQWYGVVIVAGEPAASAEQPGFEFAIDIELLDFGIAKRASSGSDLADVMRLAGKGKDSAHVSFILTLEDARGELILQSLYEGIETRHGEALPSSNAAFLAGLDFQSDKFRLSMEGRAAYKAVAAALEGLYAAMPQRGEVLSVAGDSVVIGLGSDALVRTGDRLAIYREHAIPNSEGRAVWSNFTRTGSVEVVEVRPKSCLCLVLDGVFDMAEGDTAMPQVRRELYPDEGMPDR